MRSFKDHDEALAFVQTLPWGTAAGTSRDAKMILKYAQAGAKIVAHGSNTKLARPGEPRNFGYDPRTGNSVNALRLPNRSLEAYIPELQQLKKDVNACGSELWVSFSAGDQFDADEYYNATKMLFENEAADVAEGNASCPNVMVAGKLKPSVCYDVCAYHDLVAAMRDATGTGPSHERINIKWSPITDPGIQQMLIDAGKPYAPDYIEVANTIGGCFLEDEAGNPAIPSVRGGLAGAALIPLVSGMILGMKQMLQGMPTKLIATGGVRNGEVAYNYLKLGADGFRFNTELYRRDGDPAVIHEMVMGFEDGDFTTGRKPKGLAQMLVEKGL